MKLKFTWWRSNQKESFGIWKLHKRKIVLAALFVLSLLLSNIPEKKYSTIQMTIASVLVLPERGAFFVGGVASNFAKDVLSALGASLENRKLKATQRRLEITISRQKNEIMRLRGELDALKGVRNRETTSELPLEVARVQLMQPGKIISVTSANWSRLLIVNVGSRDGIETNMPVVWDDAVVGLVYKVGPYCSAVQLITDPDFTIWAIDVESRQQGIVKGNGSPLCRMTYVPLDANVKKGDWLVSTGRAGIFPENLVVGQVAEAPEKRGVIFLDIKIKPRVDIRRLESVIILKISQPLLDLPDLR